MGGREECAGWHHAELMCMCERGLKYREAHAAACLAEICALRTCWHVICRSAPRAAGAAATIASPLLQVLQLCCQRPQRAGICYRLGGGCRHHRRMLRLLAK